MRYLEGPQPLCRTFVQVRPQRATGAYECSFMPPQAGRVAVLVPLRGEGVGYGLFPSQTASAKCWGLVWAKSASDGSRGRESHTKLVAAPLCPLCWEPAIFVLWEI